MNERIEVFVNGRKVTIYQGMTVKHALLACDQSLYTAAMAGQVRVVDQYGFALGLEGALTDGARLLTLDLSQPPA